MTEEYIDWTSMDAARFYGMLSTEEDAFTLADKLGLLYLEQVCDCGARMTRQKDSSSAHGVLFVCSSARSVCRKKASILKGSWFANSRLSMRQGFYAICGYAADMSCSQFSFFVGLKSSHTIVDWRNYFRDVCASVIDSGNSNKIGGAGCTVEVDETLVYKRKSHVGRLLANESSGVWVFGGICRESGQAFLVKVANRNADTLLQAIQDNVLPGTRIISDCWRAYSNLSCAGYLHSAVNHSYNFVDLHDKTVNTQRVERMWRTLKAIIPKTSSQETRWTYLAEFIFKQRAGWHKLSIGSRMKLILDHLRPLNFQ